MKMDKEEIDRAKHLSVHISELITFGRMFVCSLDILTSYAFFKSVKSLTSVGERGSVYSHVRAEYAVISC